MTAFLSLAFIQTVFKFWVENGFDTLDNVDKILFYLIYISYTKNITRYELKELLEKSNIKGDKIMPTLAERLISQGKKEGKIEGKKEGAEEKEEKMVLTMMKKGLSIDQIHDYTDIDEKRIKEIIGGKRH